MQKLKPCPFCGGTARYSYGNDSGDLFVIVMCNKCGIRTPKFYYLDKLSLGETRVSEKWNRRESND